MRYHDKQTSNDMMKVYFVRAVSCRLTYIDIDTATTPRRCRCAFFESAFGDRRQQTASKNRKTEMKSKWKKWTKFSRHFKWIFISITTHYSAPELDCWPLCHNQSLPLWSDLNHESNEALFGITYVFCMISHLLHCFCMLTQYGSLNKL